MHVFQYTDTCLCRLGTTIHNYLNTGTTICKLFHHKNKESLGEAVTTSFVQPVTPS